jgi:polysaccharide biosynthesis protein VpsM
MKQLYRSLLVSALIASVSHAAPFLAIGDGAELFVTGQLGVRADDNIFLDQTNTSDTIFDINPGVELTFGKDAQLQGALTLVDAFANYSDNSKLNTNLFSGDFVAKFDDSKMKLAFNAGYHELNQNAPDIRGLTRRDVFSTGGTGEVEVSQILSVGGGITYQNENYKRKNYADTQTLTIPLNLYYKWTEKIDLSAGYQYRDYNATIGQDSTDHFFNVGARGEMAPKLTGTFRVGYTQRQLSVSGSKSGLGLDSSFAYELTPKTTLQFAASNDYGTSPQGQQQRNLTLNLSSQTKISEQWSVTAGGSFRGITYDTRTDDYWEGNLGATYVYNSYLHFTGAYVYRDYVSDITSSEFKNNVFSVAAYFRY